MKGFKLSLGLFLLLAQEKQLGAHALKQSNTFLQYRATNLAQTNVGEEGQPEVAGAYLQDVSFSLSPLNKVKYQESFNHLVGMGVDEEILKEIGEGDFNHLRAIPQNALSYIKNNAENLVLIYDDQINMKNDLANGGELLKELLLVTGD
jgi:hypothetical protein